MQKWTIFILTVCFFLAGCLKKGTEAVLKEPSSAIAYYPGKVIIHGPFNTDSTIQFDQEVVIMPGTILSTSGTGEFRFNHQVSIIGSSKVFDEDANLFFGSQSISQLNPCWFGAEGWDEKDDTEAFIKVINISKSLKRNVNIIIPGGRFILREQLVLENKVPNERSINLIGEGISGNTIYGTCLQWHGPPGMSMLILKNLTPTRIENIEFTAYSTTYLLHNVELRPYINQLSFSNCSFNGCKGLGSANVDLNKGNNAQVSEISFENCVFRGYTTDNVEWQTESAVTGGLANTKNFYFRKCSFLGYTKAAIDIDISAILKVEDCTFSVNNLDIMCSLCNSLISSNYSEQSKAFFASGTSRNLSFTTLINNYFDGHLKDDYFIREGSGNLVLINNSFGGTGWSDQVNRVNWSENALSSITSLANYYRNGTHDTIPFYTNRSKISTGNIFSINDLLGPSSLDLIKLPPRSN